MCSNNTFIKFKKQIKRITKKVQKSTVDDIMRNRRKKKKKTKKKVFHVVKKVVQKSFKRGVLWFNILFLRLDVIVVGSDI
mgnify:CR=1 FL=1